MKKLLYTMMGCLMLCSAFIACSDDDGDEVINYSTTAEISSTGTYSGTWAQVIDKDTVVKEGTVTLEADTVGVSNITFTCADFSLNASSKANVWNAGYGFQFVNQADANGLGTAFSGRITDEGILTTSFTVKKKIGRVESTVIYDFTGKKN